MNNFKLVKDGEIIGESMHALDCSILVHEYAIQMLCKFYSRMPDASYVYNNQNVKCDGIVVLMNGKVCAIHKNKKDFLRQLVIRKKLNEEFVTVSPFIECGVFECYDNISEAVRKYNYKKDIYRDYPNTIIGWHIF